jgi:hypothetical protein
MANDMTVILVFAAVLALVAVGLVAYGALRIGRAVDAKTWTPVAAVILERRVIEEPVMVEQFLPSYYPVVRYRYESAAGPRESRAFSVAPKDYRSFDRLAVDRTLAAYAEGSEVVAYVCPRDDSRAILRRSVSRLMMSHYLAVLLGGLLVLVASALTIMLAWPGATA